MASYLLLRELWLAESSSFTAAPLADPEWAGLLSHHGRLVISGAELLTDVSSKVAKRLNAPFLWHDQAPMVECSNPRFTLLFKLGI
jgi:hypothetical protein